MASIIDGKFGSYNTDGNTALKIVPFYTTDDEEVKIDRPHNYKVGEKQEVYPFRDLADIRKMRESFQGNGEIRNDLMFVLGINIGLRASDLLKLKWENLMDVDGIIQDGITVKEKKTKKFRTFYLNSICREMLSGYFEAMVAENVKFVNSLKKKGLISATTADEILAGLSTRTLDGCRNASHLFSGVVDGVELPKGQKYKFYHFDYVFVSSKTGERLEVRSADKILKTTSKRVGIKFNVGTHSLRKTFGYHQLKAHNDDATFLCELQEMFGHSSPQITLRYCGLGGEKICQYYNDINLGC